MHQNSIIVDALRTRNVIAPPIGPTFLFRISSHLGMPHCQTHLAALLIELFIATRPIRYDPGLPRRTSSKALREMDKTPRKRQES